LDPKFANEAIKTPREEASGVDCPASRVAYKSGVSREEASGVDCPASRVAYKSGVSREEASGVDCGHAGLRQRGPASGIGLAVPARPAPSRRL